MLRVELFVVSARNDTICAWGDNDGKKPMTGKSAFGALADCNLSNLFVHLLAGGLLLCRRKCLELALNS